MWAPTARTTPRGRAREVTGRFVLALFVAFFAIVATVNAIMLRAATSTFGGVETGSAYKAGLEFKNELAAARTQDGRKWKIVAEVKRAASGQVTVELTARDAQAASLSGLIAAARLAHPNDARNDRRIAMSSAGAGRFTGETAAPAGQWDLVIELSADEERLFRSKTRIVLH
jgi:nitrogen fixation protein FixH